MIPSQFPWPLLPWLPYLGGTVLQPDDPPSSRHKVEVLQMTNDKTINPRSFRFIKIISIIKSQIVIDFYVYLSYEIVPRAFDKVIFDG